MISAATLMLFGSVVTDVTPVSAITSYVVEKKQKGKLTLNHNSYVYTKKGKRTGKLLRKGKSVKYVGKVSVNNDANNFYFYQDGIASDVKWVDGERLKPTNTADEAENNSKIALTETNELDLKDLINKADSVRNTTKYKLSCFYKRYNYDQAIRDAQTKINSRKLMSTAEAQYLIWNFKTYENELDGAKIKVNNMNKLTSDEKLAINLLVDVVYTRETDTERLDGSTKFSKGNNKTFKLVIEDENQHNKVVSTETMNVSDFAEKR